MAVGGIDRNLFNLIVNRNVSKATAIPSYFFDLKLINKFQTMLSGLSSQADRRMEIHCNER